MHYDIVALPKDQWKGTPIPLTTRSDSYYDFEFNPLNSEGCIAVEMEVAGVQAVCDFYGFEMYDLFRDMKTEEICIICITLQTI